MKLWVFFYFRKNVWNFEFFYFRKDVWKFEFLILGKMYETEFFYYYYFRKDVWNFKFTILWKMCIWKCMETLSVWNIYVWMHEIQFQRNTNIWMSNSLRKCITAMNFYFDKMHIWMLKFWKKCMSAWNSIFRKRIYECLKFWKIHECMKFYFLWMIMP